MKQMNWLLLTIGSSAILTALVAIILMIPVNEIRGSLIVISGVGAWVAIYHLGKQPSEASDAIVGAKFTTHPVGQLICTGAGLIHAGLILLKWIYFGVAVVTMFFAISMEEVNTSDIVFEGLFRLMASDNLSLLYIISMCFTEIGYVVYLHAKHWQAAAGKVGEYHHNLIEELGNEI